MPPGRRRKALAEPSLSLWVPHLPPQPRRRVVEAGFVLK